jgi:hypothetical protein
VIRTRFALVVALLGTSYAEPSVPNIDAKAVRAIPKTDASITGPTFVIANESGGWQYDIETSYPELQWVEWYNGSTYLGSSDLGATFTHSPSSTFTLQARRSTWFGSQKQVLSTADLYVEVAGTADPDWCQSANNSTTCATNIYADPAGAAPEQTCTYGFSTTLPADSWVIWKVDGVDKLSGYRNVIGDSFQYTHPVNESFELRVHVSRHYANHAEKTITVGSNQDCDATRSAK